MLLSTKDQNTGEIRNLKREIRRSIGKRKVYKKYVKDKFQQTCPDVSKRARIEEVPMSQVLFN